MKKILLCAAILLSGIGSAAHAAGTELYLRGTGTFSLAVSPRMAEHLAPGAGGGWSVILKKHFWPLWMEFEISDVWHPLRDDATASFQMVNCTMGLHYPLPVRLFGKVGIAAFARAGIALEILTAGGAADVNTAFTAGWGGRLTLPLTRVFTAGFALQHVMLIERDEAASFFQMHLSLDLKL